MLRLRTALNLGETSGPTPFPVHPALAALLPERGLRPGAAYTLAASSTLLLTLLAEPSRAGSWCGVVGLPELGAEAAEHAGVELSRLVLVPTPGERWLSVVAALTEVLPVVVVRPSSRVREADASRLSARLRDREAVLLVAGDWPQAHARISLAEPRWTGLGEGHGHLTTREVTLTVTGRRIPVPRSTRVLLPDPDGRLATGPQHEGIDGGDPGFRRDDVGQNRDDVGQNRDDVGQNRPGPPQRHPGPPQRHPGPPQRRPGPPQRHPGLDPGSPPPRLKVAG